MYLGIDLGTSGVKLVLLDERQTIVVTHSTALALSRPQPLWSEQNPHDWWQAVNAGIQALKNQHDLKQVKAIGLTGQMHGAVMLDKQNQPLYPAILWNDGRSVAECQELEQQVPDSRLITGNLMMPGFTAPKLKWFKKHQPQRFEKIHKVLLPKDYLRLLMTGRHVSDMSDAAGTLWLDVGKRAWNNELLTACGLSIENMPELMEGNQISGYLLPDIADQWGMNPVPVVAGGGDNAAGAIGVGLYKAGQAMLSLGTSGVYFVVTDKFVSNPESAVHSFCHALPERWHLMSVILSAAACVDWANQALGIHDIPHFFELAASAEDSDVIFLPYLSGERTPHNDPYAKGVFWGMDHNSTQAILAKAVLEGVSFALAQGIEVLHASGVAADNITLIGGGAKSHYWRQLLADISGKTLEYRQGGDVGPALGAAKLAQIALNPDKAIADFCPPLVLEHIYQPNPARQAYYHSKKARFNQLYLRLKGFI
ncbi:xylulokinase [Testudinibacter aquarius]|uniref:Xylulose kinase n=1 Tax=Testudinibacter aquarius TaxID=1524974 RepID=A0A4R3YAT7_9PAST|nr:xylulokinase [Testudinibacter aquarius]KAE9528351.1 xylulokinase [Testudinibacter aquarius]TCV88811.1 xylulokinase [Testudinibacter aquarius]TNG90791.1 xylulokinase [Testudinibacter aquarius]